MAEGASPGHDRRADPLRPHVGGRRWTDDPDPKAAFDRLTLRLSQDIYALRVRQGWSLDATARAAGLDPQTLLDLEKTRTDPRLSTLVRLLFVLGLELHIGYRPAPAAPELTRGKAGLDRVHA